MKQFIHGLLKLSNIDSKFYRYQPLYGARPIKRCIQKHIETPIAKLIVDNELLPNHKLSISVKDSKLVYGIE